jgi:hypothetical protein
MEGWVLCYINLQKCGGDGQNRPFVRTSLRKWYLFSDVPLNGDLVAHAFIFWVRLIPADRYFGDRARTEQARCEPAPYNACKYPVPPRTATSPQV